jgi:hypothetical protein
VRHRSVPSFIRISLVVALVLATFDAFIPSTAQAAPQLTSTMIRLDDMHAGHTSTGTVCIQPVTAGTEKYILVQFPTQFTLSTTLSPDWTVGLTQHPNDPADLYWPSGALPMPALTATNVNTGTNTVTFTLGTATALNVLDNYCFNWSNALAITTVGAANVDLQGNVTTKDTSSVVIDQGFYALTVVADNTITVNATVPPIFEFIMGSNSDVFAPDLAPGAIRTTGGVTPTINTNAKGGWIMWAKDANQSLDSTASGGSIPSVGWNTALPTALVAGTPGYAMNVVTAPAGGTFCTESVAAEYDTVTNGGDGGALLANFEQIGDCTGGPSNGDGLTISEAAAISVTTPASTDYTDTIFVVGAGLF